MFVGDFGLPQIAPSVHVSCLLNLIKYGAAIQMFPSAVTQKGVRYNAAAGKTLHAAQYPTDTAVRWQVLGSPRLTHHRQRHAGRCALRESDHSLENTKPCDLQSTPP